MMKQVTVIYEDGVLKPLEELDIEEYEKLIATLYPVDQWEKELEYIVS